MSVIDTATNAVVGSPIAVGDAPFGVAVTPDGSRVYVANAGDDVSVIDTATNTVVADRDPGRRIVPTHSASSSGRRRRRSPGLPGPRTAPAGASRPRRATMAGRVRPPAGLGYASVAKLQTAIRAFCKG